METLNLIVVLLLFDQRVTGLFTVAAVGCCPTGVFSLFGCHGFVAFFLSSFVDSVMDFFVFFGAEWLGMLVVEIISISVREWIAVLFGIVVL